MKHKPARQFRFLGRPGNGIPQSTACPTCGSSFYLRLWEKQSPSERGLTRHYVRCGRCGEEYVFLRAKAKESDDAR